MSRDLYWKLDRLGRVRLSKHYQMRQFLHSEIGQAFGIVNYPDDPDLAIEAARGLCSNILEPLTEEFGPLIVRSGYRSPHLNAFGAKMGLACASNEKNRAYHCYDLLDANGSMGASACIIIPSALGGDAPRFTDWRELAWHIDATLPYHRMAFFKSFSFNIGFKEANREASIFSRTPKPHWLKRHNPMGS
ncbi:hypothetical protein PhaeoP30_00471 [Phaeobacter inhibens]|nr:hypothetical protein PhaeoP30_00471 [Phaeobacter inhibens]